MNDPRIQAVAEELLRDYSSEYSAGHLTWLDFKTEALNVLGVADAVDPLRQSAVAPSVGAVLDPVEPGGQQ